MSSLLCLESAYISGEFKVNVRKTTHAFLNYVNIPWHHLLWQMQISVEKLATLSVENEATQFSKIILIIKWDWLN